MKGIIYQLKRNALKIRLGKLHVIEYVQSFRKRFFINNKRGWVRMRFFFIDDHIGPYEIPASYRSNARQCCEVEKEGQYNNTPEFHLTFIFRKTMSFFCSLPNQNLSGYIFFGCLSGFSRNQ